MEQRCLHLPFFIFTRPLATIPKALNLCRTLFNQSLQGEGTKSYTHDGCQQLYFFSYLFLIIFKRPLFKRVPVHLSCWAYYYLNDADLKHNISIKIA